MGDEERDALLTDYTEFASLAKKVQDTFLTCVRSVGDRGYEIASGERFVGGLDVGVLVGTLEAITKAALIVATLKGAHGPDPERIKDAAISAGKKITNLMGIDRREADASG